MNACKLLVLFVLIELSVAHICLMYPPQRGGYDISEPASYSCYQPTAPCGTKTPRSPKITLEGGRTFYVFLQQNLNHYNPGYAGFIDVGIAVGTNQTSDSDFTTLATISDYWAHFQATQTNFSIPVKIPDMDCEWCTLQVRYHPNKPTEPIFHNCADVKISQTVFQTPVGQYIGLVKPGPIYAASEQYTKFMDLYVPDGTLQPLVGLNSHIAQRSEQQNLMNIVVANGMITQSVEGGMLFFGYDVNFQGYPCSTLYHYSRANNNFTSTSVAFPLGITQWDGIISTYDESGVSPYLIIGQQEDASQSLYTFSAFWFYANGSTSAPIATSSPDATFVNYLWSDYSPCAGEAGQLYVLVGDENSLTALNAKLFTFDIATKSVSSVLVDNSQFTVSSIHTWPEADCKNLYTLSPGLVDTDPSERVWSLVTIDPTTGTVSNPVAVSSPGEYTNYYGGAVYGKSVNPRSQLPYLFQRQNDKTFEMKLINLVTRSVDSTAAVNLGVNSMYSLSSLTYFVAQ